MSEEGAALHRDRLAEVRHKFTSTLISEYIPCQSRVLDVGGHKECPYWLPFKNKYDVVSVNIDAAISPDHVLDVEKDDLGQLKEKFNYVTMFEVIEHVENPMAALRNIRAVLKDSSSLFIGSTPNRLDPYMFVRPRIDEGHNYVFDKLTIKHLLLKCGFETIAVKNRVLPIQLSRRIFIPIDVSKVIHTGRVVFWVAKIL